ncbi:carboxylating nicotinate-nucleotide diphosphorylase [Candidatus Sumerlaeota bacterium]|nr:carboxylating nicotinate-nucleotide diphosphorylase [Candidatus Sumerlaeota bacterium]
MTPRLKIDDSLRRQLKDALREDIGSGDITTQLTIVHPKPGGAAMLAREDGVFCGFPVARELTRIFDPKLRLKALVPDGTAVREGDWVMTLRGDVRSLLTVERVLLNFVQRLSGVATLTRRYVELTGGPDSPVKIFDTRKTNPGWRTLERYAVRVGGGVNHRYGLFDAVLIKNNHADFAGGLEHALAAVHAGLKRRKKKIPVIVETRNLNEVRIAVEGGCDVVMLDNMSLPKVRKALALVPSGIDVELSGGIEPRRIRQLATLGVPRISVGAITHSAPAMDFSLRQKSLKELKAIERCI